jgi:DNA-binding response OmpR family regulator
MRILVLEDDHKVATFIQRGLEEEGYAVDVLHDGLQAGVQTQSIDYDAAVLDLMPPAPRVCRCCATFARRSANCRSSSSALEILSKTVSLVSMPAPTTTWPSRSR